MEGSRLAASSRGRSPTATKQYCDFEFIFRDFLVDILSVIDGRVAHFELGQIPEHAIEMRAAANFLVANYGRQKINTVPRSVPKTRKPCARRRHSALKGNGGREGVDLLLKLSAEPGE
jgi:hypothetical protein